MNTDYVIRKFLLHMRNCGMKRVVTTELDFFPEKVSRIVDLNNEPMDRVFSWITEEMQQKKCNAYFIRQFQEWSGHAGVFEIHMQIK